MNKNPEETTTNMTKDGNLTMDLTKEKKEYLKCQICMKLEMRLHVKMNLMDRIAEENIRLNKEVKPKAKYPIKADEEKEDIINQHEHKRRLYKRNMLVISNPLKNPIKTSNLRHQSLSRQYMLHERKMVYYTIAIPNQYD